MLVNWQESFHVRFGRTCLRADEKITTPIRAIKIPIKGEPSAPPTAGENTTADIRTPSGTDRDDLNQKRHWWQKFTNDLGMFVLTLSTLIALIFYTVYTRQLVIDTEESYASLQRAFVTPLPIQADLSVDERGERAWTFTTTIENSGTTPTRDMSFYQVNPCFFDDKDPIIIDMNSPDAHCVFDVENGKMMPIGEPTDPAKAYGRKGVSIGRYPLGPRDKVTIGKVYVLEKRIIQTTISSKHPWYLSGVIFYNDVFAGTLQHQTKYCYTIVMWPFTGGPDSHPLLAPCPKWNCADAECY